MFVFVVRLLNFFHFLLYETKNNIFNSSAPVCNILNDRSLTEKIIDHQYEENWQEIYIFKL